MNTLSHNQSELYQNKTAYASQTVRNADIYNNNTTNFNNYTEEFEEHVTQGMLQKKYQVLTQALEREKK